jgi:hypothetical protein
MTSNEVAPVIPRPEIRCSLTVDELNAVVDKVIDALPDNLADEWLTGLEDTDFPPLSEEDEEAFRHAFWQAACVVVEGLVKYRLTAEPLIAEVEAITGVDRSTFEACTESKQCLLRALGDLSGCGACQTTSNQP